MHEVAGASNRLLGQKSLQNHHSQNVDYTDPSKDVELDEYELAEVMSRPYMDPNHARFGHKPNSNLILMAEQQLIEQKRDKCIEIFKQCSEVFDILEAAKKDPVLQQATNGGQGLDPTSMCDVLLRDKHFNNSKWPLN